MKDEKIELVHGSGNVFRDFGRPDADFFADSAVRPGAVYAGLAEDDPQLAGGAGRGQDQGAGC